MSTIRLTTAQAIVKYLANQFIRTGDREERYFAGVWAIFGHGNVAGLGEALYQVRDTLPTLRAHNEQGMAHAAIAYAKSNTRQRAMICTTSIGPGATNMVTAAALAHVNRLPVLFLPGDVFANRGPDPVLQQIEDFDDGTVSANDCFRPVSRYFDRIMRPEQILTALPRAMATFMDPGRCGPVTLSLCQDVQAEAHDFPESFFEKRVWRIRRPVPALLELQALTEAIRGASRPLIIAGGGVLYSGASEALSAIAQQTRIPVCETQAGKSALRWDHPQNVGSIGVTGASAANAAAESADLVIGIGTRLQDFTTGSRALFEAGGQQLIQVNVTPYDAYKHNAQSVVGDAREVLDYLNSELQDYVATSQWIQSYTENAAQWKVVSDAATALPSGAKLPSDAQVIGAVQRSISQSSIVVCAAGGLPGELHKLWRSSEPGSYHVEYGYSCMGYEVAAGMGAKMACPDKDVYVLVGDGSYLMLNSELATSVMLGIKITVVILDNRGFGCINRLQNATGGKSFNNLLRDTHHNQLPAIDFVAHAASLGAVSEKAGNVTELEEALSRASDSENSYVIVIDTDAEPTTAEGGCWWDVAVPELSKRDQVLEARKNYMQAIARQARGG